MTIQKLRHRFKDRRQTEFMIFLSGWHLDIEHFMRIPSRLFADEGSKISNSLTPARAPGSVGKNGQSF